MTWAPGDVIVTRQVWRGRVVAGFPALIIEATDDHVITYLPTGAELGFVDGAYPGPTGQHPWHGRAGWDGHGMLTIVPRTGFVAIQHFWIGPEREFACWYLNIQEPMRPTSIGFDSQDLELDLVVRPDGSWIVKDDELLERQIAEGRWTVDEVRLIREIGARTIRDVLEPRSWWWDRSWSRWRPDGSVEAPRLPEGWADAPVPDFAGLPALIQP